MPAAERPHRLALVGAVAVVVFVVGTVLTFVSRPSPERARTEPQASGDRPGPTTPVGTVGPAAERAHMPVGFADTEQGAAAAAVAYATASQRWLYFSDDEINHAVSQIATP